MKSKEYWEGRFIELQKSQLKRADLFAHELEDLHARMQKEIDDDITVWHKKVATANGISMADAKKLMSRKDRKEFQWTLEEYQQHAKADLLSGVTSANVLNASANWHLSYLDGMKLQLEHHVDKLYKNIDSKTKNHFKESLNDNYLNTAFELQKGIGIGEKMEVPYDERKLENILRTPWASDGKNFSQRIWKDRTQLVNNLQKNLSESVIRGDSDTDMIQALSKDEKRAEFNTRRLVETESAYFDSLSEQECCEDFGVEKYRYLAVLDMKTSDICQELDNKVFLEKDRQVGVNAPPMHPFCRSTTAPVIDEDFLTSRRAKNPKTGKYDEIPPEMNYKQWKEKYVEGKEENTEAIKQEQVKAESSKDYEIKFENKNVGYEYKETPLESKTSEFDSNAYEDRVKKQAEKQAEKLQELQERQIDKKIINATKTAKPNPIEPPPDILNEKDLREETQKLFEGFNINAELEDFSEETVRGLNITFTKIKEEIGENIEITTIKTIKSSEKICNQIIQDGYIENKLNEDIKDYKNKEQKKPSDNWIEEKLKEIENNIKESMGLQESKNGKQVLGFYAPKDCKEFKITYGRDREDLSGLYLSEKFINERNSLEYKNSLEAVKNKYWQPLNCDNSNGTINHEIGHAIDDFLGLSDNASKNGIKDLYEADFNRYSNYYSNFLSEYSFYKEINNRRHYKKHPELPSRFREFIAEAISEYLTTPKPRKPRKLSIDVWEIVKNGLKDKRKSK